MVTCKLMGGLGNQLFMMSATIGYALKHNMDYAIPLKVDNPHYEGQKPYIFNGVKYTDSPLDLPEYKEAGYPFQAIPYMENLCLNGYWQTEKYFAGIRPHILHAFQFPYSSKPGSGSDPAPAIVAIHVRRGDYLKLPDYHPTVSMDYISKSIRYFNDKGFYRFKIFSDGMDWCKDNINSERIVASRFEYSDGKTEIEDLVAASHCDHIIGSNSTFSWWAYYLNQNPGKLSTFPAVWFGRFMHGHDTRDLYPEGCVKF